MHGDVHIGGAPAVERDAPNLQAVGSPHEVHIGDQRPRPSEPHQRRRRHRVLLHPWPLLHGDECRRLSRFLALRLGRPTGRSPSQVSIKKGLQYTGTQ